MWYINVYMFGKLSSVPSDKKFFITHFFDTLKKAKNFEATLKTGVHLSYGVCKIESGEQHYSGKQQFITTKDTSE